VREGRDLRGAVQAVHRQSGGCRPAEPGSSSVLAVGAGSVGDIYRPTERATAMGWYYSGVSLDRVFVGLVTVIGRSLSESWLDCRSYYEYPDDRMWGFDSLSLTLNTYSFTGPAFAPVLAGLFQEYTAVSGSAKRLVRRECRS
jgi:hypothetical protein